MTELSTHTFELDLTSVCVSSGTIQLPLKMQQYFAPGSVEAEVDGQALVLEFQAPRRLGGLRQHFAEREMRSNDRVRFSLDVEDGRVVGMRATCVRRERPKPAENPVLREQGRAAAEGSTSEPSGAWQSANEVRAVKRVRIPGLPVAPAPAVMARLPDDRTQSQASRPQTATRGGWSSAHEDEVFDDGMTTVRAVRRRSASAPAQDERQAGEAPPAARAQTVSRPQAPQPREPRREVVRPIQPATEEPVAATPLQLSDLIAPPLAEEETDAAGRRPRSWTLPPRLRFGGRNGARQPHTRGPSRQPSGEESGAERRSAPEEAAPRVEVVRSEGVQRVEPRAQVAATAPMQATPAAGRDHPGASRDDQKVKALAEARELVGVGANGPAPQAAAPGPGRLPVDERRPATPGARIETAQVTSRADARQTALADGAGFAGRSGVSQAPPAPSRQAPPQPALQETSGTSSSAKAPPLASEPAPPANGAPRLKVVETAAKERLLIDDADFGGDYLVRAPAPRQAGAPAAGSLEDDIAAVDAYLRKPGTPAIVRSDAVGELLAIGDERAERALERISEKPDLVSRIRRGAYMVRRRKD